MRYTVLESVRNRIVWVVLGFAVVGLALAAFVGDYAVVDNRRSEIGILAAFYRFAAALTLMALVVTTTTREFNDKCPELYLSLPLSRHAYVIGKLLGFFVIAAAVTSVFAAVLFLYINTGAVNNAADTGDAVGGGAALALWAGSLAGELMIVASVAFLCALTFNNQATASMVAVFFFYVLCRIGDDIVLISQSETLVHTTATSYLDEAARLLVAALPALGRFAQSEWLLYGIADAARTAALVGAQTLIYTTLATAMACVDFYRKNL